MLVLEYSSCLRSHEGRFWGRSTYFEVSNLMRHQCGVQTRKIPSLERSETLRFLEFMFQDPTLLRPWILTGGFWCFEVCLLYNSATLTFRQRVWFSVKSSLWQRVSFFKCCLPSDFQTMSWYFDWLVWAPPFFPLRF